MTRDQHTALYNSASTAATNRLLEIVQELVDTGRLSLDSAKEAEAIALLWKCIGLDWKYVPVRVED